VKKLTDGLPSPLILRLHRSSSFSDMEYLTKQSSISPAIHGGASTQQACLLTILYSQLIARLLGRLGALPHFSTDSIIGRLNRLSGSYEHCCCGAYYRCEAGLWRQIEEGAARDSLVAAFAGWLRLSDIKIPVLAELAAVAAKTKGASRTYRDVAVLGFAVTEPNLRVRAWGEFLRIARMADGPSVSSRR